MYRASRGRSSIRSWQRRARATWKAPAGIDHPNVHGRCARGRLSRSARGSIQSYTRNEVVVVRFSRILIFLVRNLASCAGRRLLSHRRPREITHEQRPSLKRKRLRRIVWAFGLTNSHVMLTLDFHGADSSETRVRYTTNPSPRVHAWFSSPSARGGSRGRRDPGERERRSPSLRVSVSRSVSSFERFFVKWRYG